MLNNLEVFVGFKALNNLNIFDGNNVLSGLKIFAVLEILILKRF